MKYQILTAIAFVMVSQVVVAKHSVPVSLKPGNGNRTESISSDPFGENGHAAPLIQWNCRSASGRTTLQVQAGSEPMNFWLVQDGKTIRFGKLKAECTRSFPGQCSLASQAGPVAELVVGDTTSGVIFPNKNSKQKLSVTCDPEGNFPARETESAPAGTVFLAVQRNVGVRVSDEFQGDSFSAQALRAILKNQLKRAGLEIVDSPNEKFGVFEGSISESQMDDLRKIRGVKDVFINGLQFSNQ